MCVQAMGFGIASVCQSERVDIFTLVWQREIRSTKFEIRNTFEEFQFQTL